ncbi:MAG: ATP synthase F0 subunit A [Candidatus Hydrogenedentota bacterium]|nr:MAG: ATP synthase F0 subunit A [Candidatus Hydrogenedentota bacterium]
MTLFNVVLTAAEKFNLDEVVVHHLGDQPLWHLEIGGMDMSITKRVVMMWIASVLLLAIFIPLARKIAKNPYAKPSRWQSLLESLIQFVRFDVGKASMHLAHKSYDGFLLSLFFFILFCNLLGLIPPLGELVHIAGTLFGTTSSHHGHELPLAVKLWPASTATGDIAVTGTLAVISFIAIQISGLIYQGIAYIKNIVPKGVPLPLWVIMWPIEVLGQFTKPFALAIRLLANMTAGHLIILVLMSFIFQFQSYLVAPASILGSTAIYMLEIFVAFLQAYIFVFLTALFIAGAQHRH